MGAKIPDFPPQRGGDFRMVADAFLAGEGLPFADVLTAERIERVCAKHGRMFGSVCSTALVLWAFLSQVLRDGKEASCQAAVARIVSHCEQTDTSAPTKDTGDYCRARAKLSEAALRELSGDLAVELERGKRTRAIDIITTLVDADEFPKEAIAELYGFRRNSELDIRSIKSNLNLGHVRCKSPEMVRRELWTTILGYNLIRTTAASAALLHGEQPRQISFTGTCQYVLACWMQLSSGLVPAHRPVDSGSAETAQSSQAPDAVKIIRSAVIRAAPPPEPVRRRYP